MQPEIFRRIVHMAVPLSLVFYWLPEQVFQVQKVHGLLVFCCLVLLFECIRLKSNILFPGLRDYESKRIGSYAWAAMGLTFAYALFPLQWTGPVVVCMAFIDPFAGELRKKGSRMYPVAPLAVYFLLFTAVYFLIQKSLEPALLFLVAVAASVSVALEYPKLYHLDDDLILIAAPLLSIWLLEKVLLFIFA